MTGKELRKESGRSGTQVQSSKPFFAPSRPIQAKLTVNRPGDKFEQEADSMADIIVNNQYRSPALGDSSIGTGRSKFPSNLGSTQAQVQQKCELCEAEESPEREEHLQRMPSEKKIVQTWSNHSAQPVISNDTEKRLKNTSSRGAPIHQKTKIEMERGFGVDFSHVRIHTDNQAEQMNRELGAQAFTHGSNIYFNQGKFNTHSKEGKRLLAHELTHVVQQGSATRSRTNSVPVVQRQDETDQPEALSAADRSFLYDRITFRMGIAYDKFVDACNSHQRQLRDQAAQNAAFAGLILDLVLAFATRGISRVISAGISGAVRREASDVVYRIALGALDRADEITAAATTVGKEVAKRGFESIFSRSSDEQFVEDLKQVMSVHLDATHGNMGNLDDEQLTILYFDYDPSLITIAYYEHLLAQLISDFRAQIDPIGDRTDERYGVNRLRWIEGRSRRALALTGEGRYFMADGRPRFMAWITPFFRGEALRRSRPQTESTFPVVHYGSLEGGSAPANIGAILDSPHVTSDNFVFAAPTGQTPVQPPSCPSCHGEMGAGTSPGFSGSAFDFSQFDQPQTEDIIREWLRQSEPR